MTSAGFAELILKPVADLRSMFWEKNNKEFLKTLSSVLLCDVIHQNMMGVSQIICQKCQREVLQFLRVLEQLEKFWEKCNKALRIRLAESCTGNDRSAA